MMRPRFAPRSRSGTDLRRRLSMTDPSKREELIEEAAKAIGEVTYTTSNDQVRAARAALAVFEQAHTPTDKSLDITLNNLLIEDVKPMYAPSDDERGAALKAVAAAREYTDGGCQEDREIADAILGAGFRRTAVQEPSADDEHSVEAWSPTGRIDSPVSCKKCDRYLFIGADGEWQHVGGQGPQGEPPNAPTVRLMARKGGKTQALIDSMLAQANERGIRVEVVHPQGEPTDAERHRRAQTQARIHIDHEPRWNLG